MSFEAMAWAVQQKLPATQKIVLLMLANRINKDTGKCVPRIKTLAEDCGLSESGTKTALKALCDAGLISAQARFQEGVQLANSYQINMGGVVGQHPTQCGLPKNPGVGQEVTTEPVCINQEVNLPPKPPTGGRGRTFSAWVKEINEKGEVAIPESHAIFAYCERIGIPMNFVELAWLEFKDRHMDSDKRQKDWRKAFHNYVRNNYYKLWYCDDSGTYRLTTQGKQAAKAQE